MEDRKGYFVAIDGGLGASGFDINTKLEDKLKSKGYDVVYYDFPRYSKPSSYFIDQYLSGKYGGTHNVGPYTGSLFYALDHFEAASSIRDDLSNGRVVVASGYVASSMSLQGSKFEYPEERRGFFVWLDNIEFEMLRIPRPDVNLVLYGKDGDIIPSYEQLSSQGVQESRYDLCKLFPKDFNRVDLVRNNQPITEDELVNILWEKIHPQLPKVFRLPKAGKNKVSQSDNRLTTSATGQSTSQNESKQNTVQLEKILSAVSDPENTVYGIGAGFDGDLFYQALSRSRREKIDLKTVIKDSIRGASIEGRNTDIKSLPIPKEINPSLVNVKFVIENASSLLVNFIKKHQRYIDSLNYTYRRNYESKNQDGSYFYYLPASLNGEARNVYSTKMNQLFDLYSSMIRTLTSYLRKTLPADSRSKDPRSRLTSKNLAVKLLMPVLPVAASSSLLMSTSAEKLNDLLEVLLAGDLKEAQEAATKILSDSMSFWPEVFERQNLAKKLQENVDQSIETNNIIKGIAAKELSGKYSGPQPISVKLGEFWPKNELSLLTDLIYFWSSMTSSELRKEVELWPYEKKLENLSKLILAAENQSGPGLDFSKTFYSFDITSEYGILNSVRDAGIMANSTWQTLTPRNGYVIPDQVENAGLSEPFEKCFDIGLELYSYLQEANYVNEAQYATLFGHRINWKTSMNLRQALELKQKSTDPNAYPGYDQFLEQICQGISEVNPLIGSLLTRD